MLSGGANVQIIGSFSGLDSVVSYAAINGSLTTPLILGIYRLVVFNSQYQLQLRQIFTESAFSGIIRYCRNNGVRLLDLQEKDYEGIAGELFLYKNNSDLLHSLKRAKGNFFDNGYGFATSIATSIASGIVGGLVLFYFGYTMPVMFAIAFLSFGLFYALKDISRYVVKKIQIKHSEKCLNHYNGMYKDCKLTATGTNYIREMVVGLISYVMQNTDVMKSLKVTEVMDVRYHLSDIGDVISEDEVSSLVKSVEKDNPNILLHMNSGKLLDKSERTVYVDDSEKLTGNAGAPYTGRRSGP